MRPALDATRQALVTQHQHIALGIARKMWSTRRHLPKDDFVSSAQLGLVQAAQTYEPEREVPFPPYASCRIVGSIRDWIGGETRARALCRAAEQVALGVATHLTEDEGALEADDQAQRESVHDRAMAIRAAFFIGLAANIGQHTGGERELVEREAHVVAGRAVRAAIADLPERDRNVLEGHYFAGQPLQALASQIGVSYRTVRRVHDDALVRLGRRLSQSGITEAPAVPAGL